MRLKPSADSVDSTKLPSFVLACSILVACSCCHSTPPARTDDPALALSPTEQRAACEKASLRLAEKKCKEARPDFADFCMNTLEAGIPLQPICLAQIQDCLEVDTKCRK